MHDSVSTKMKRKHQVAIYENKHARGRPKGKGYRIAATCTYSIYYIYDRNFALHYPKKIGINTCFGDGQKVCNDD